uniref:ABM domain-containing protein n=1 Tax=Thermomicrobium roseum TaxID=500 RepID=A0A7C5VXJ0_THERO
MVLRPFTLPSPSREQEAFTRLRPTTSHYQTVPIERGFNWEEALRDVPSGEWYLVVFRSLRRPDSDDVRLTEFDDHAYEEAFATGGLLCYFAGDLDENRHCLSFCVWKSREAARVSAQLPKHEAAAALAPSTYVWYRLERYTVRKDPETSRIEFIPLPE